MFKKLIFTLFALLFLTNHLGISPMSFASLRTDMQPNTDDVLELLGALLKKKIDYSIEKQDIFVHLFPAQNNEINPTKISSITLTYKNDKIFRVTWNKYKSKFLYGNEKQDITKGKYKKIIQKFETLKQRFNKIKT